MRALWEGKMGRKLTKVLAVAALLQGAVMAREAVADKATPGFNTKIPESILTPDTVKTRVGTLEFFDGIPTKETAALLLENLDLNRGVDTFLNGMPAANVEAARRGHVALGQEKSNQVLIFDELMDSNSLFLTGNTVRTLFWYERDKSAFLYEGRNWKRGFVGGSHEYLKDQGLGGRNIDARGQYFYMATFNSPALVWQLIGKGSKYAWGYLDNNGDYLDGNKSYKLNLPKDVPAEQFMSVVVYDTQTRSQLQTSQPFPSKNNKRDKMIINNDGSIDIYFGPKAPEGKEANWIQTVPEKGWFCLLRLYSPTEAWYDKTWRPGEIELVK